VAHGEAQHTVAVVTDGTAVHGLADLGPAAALPVMEGKAALFQAVGGVDAWPAEAIANCGLAEELNPSCIVPSVFDTLVASAVAAAVIAPVPAKEK
jgi:malic enzyme